MALECNAARGEVPLKVGEVDLVIAATMKGLSATSTALGCQSLGDLFLRLSQTEITATMAGISHLTVLGDKEKAIEELSLSDFPACAKAFSDALAHHFKDKAKKGKAAETTT